MSDATSLVDRVIIVTGGTGRLGNAVTKLLLQRGAEVVVTYTKHEELTKLQSRLSAQELEHFSTERVNVTNENEVQNFVTKVMANKKKIDGLANLVGGWASTPLPDVTLEDWQSMMNLNLTSAFLMTKTFLPHMVKAKYGRILGVGAQSALQAAKNQAQYNVSKVGVMWLMETIAHEYRDVGITANAILPSAIKTEAEHEASADKKSVWVRPEEVAELTAYLLSPASGATSGAKIPVLGRV